VGSPLGWLLVGCDAPAGDHSRPLNTKTLTNNGLTPSAFRLAGHVYAQLGAVRWFSSEAVSLCDSRPPNYPMSSSTLPSIPCFAHPAQRKINHTRARANLG